MGARTITLRRKRSPDVRTATPQLFVLLDGDHPTSLSSRHLLTELDVVWLRRGRARLAERRARGPQRALELSLPDSFMSQTHARLLKVHGRWTLTDEGSKNGSLVNGVAVMRALLADCDVIELGHTFLLFRDAVPAVDGQADLESADVTAPLPGLVSFSALLWRELGALDRLARADLPVLIQGPSGWAKRSSPARCTSYPGAAAHMSR